MDSGLTMFLTFFVHTSFYIVKDSIVALLVVASVWSGDVVLVNVKVYPLGVSCYLLCSFCC